jgi:hypothetical protein
VWNPRLEALGLRLVFFLIGKLLTWQWQRGNISSLVWVELEIKRCRESAFTNSKPIVKIHININPLSYRRTNSKK